MARKISNRQSGIRVRREIAPPTKPPVVNITAEAIDRLNAGEFCPNENGPCGTIEDYDAYLVDAHRRRALRWIAERGHQRQRTANMHKFNRALMAHIVERHADWGPNARAFESLFDFCFFIDDSGRGHVWLSESGRKILGETV